MSNKRESNLTATATVAVVAAGVAVGYGVYRAVEWLFSSKKPHQNLPHQNRPIEYREQLRLPVIRRPPPSTLHPCLQDQVIHVVNTVEQCRYSMRQLKSYCDEYGVLGFGCKWVVSEQGKDRHPVALLQLATHSGLCVLIRLSELRIVPAELEEILEDASIIKVGVAPVRDVEFLNKDYGVRVASTLDLRYVAEVAKRPIARNISLTEMANECLGISPDKNPYIQRSNWQAPTLSNTQIDYAATTAHVAIELFKYFTECIEPNQRPEYIIENHFVEHIDQDYDCIEHIDQPGS